MDDTVMLVPLQDKATAGLPPATKLVPVITTDVEPAAMFVAAVLVTVGTARMVPTVADDALAIVYMVTAAEMV